MPVDGTTIGIILAGIVSLVTAAGTIQTRRETRRKEEIASLRADLAEQGREIARQRRTNIAAIRWVYAVQMVMAARGFEEAALPAMPVELEELFYGVESQSHAAPPAGGSPGRPAGAGGAHRSDAAAAP